jgi:hypothetical protein
MKKKTMNKMLFALAVATAFTGSLAHADEAKPDNEVSFNVAGVSDYRYRGISQTRLKPPCRAASITSTTRRACGRLGLHHQVDQGRGRQRTWKWTCMRASGAS